MIIDESASEYFKRVHEAHAYLAGLSDKLRELDEGPSITQSYSESVAHTQAIDKQECHVLNKISMEDLIRYQNEDRYELIEQSKAIAMGLQALYPERKWGMALYYYYGYNLIQKAVADRIGMSYPTMKKEATITTALDMVDKEGFTRCWEAYVDAQDKLLASNTESHE